MRALNIFNNTTSVIAVLIFVYFQTFSEYNKHEQPLEVQGDMGSVMEVIYYYLFLLFQDAVSVECSWHHHILGKCSAFHLELRDHSGCTKG